MQNVLVLEKAKKALYSNEGHPIVLNGYIRTLRVPVSNKDSRKSNIKTELIVHPLLPQATQRAYYLSSETGKYHITHPPTMPADI